MEISFSPLQEDDLPMLFEWLNRPHLREWWGGEVSVDDVREKYLPRIMGRDAARPYIAWLDGRAAGYIQYYHADEGDPDWWPDDPGQGVLGIDQFLAEEESLDKGLGRALVSAFSQWLFEERGAIEIRVDPRPDNVRAIRCYEKAGFQAVKEIVTPDGPALWMVLYPW